jgi:hypothetical protein
MKTKLNILISGMSLLLVLSCSKYPPSSERILEDLAVLTNYDTRINFNNYKTYSLASNVIQITDNGKEPMTGETAAAALAQIDRNMQSRGFVKVADNAKPDLGIQVFYFQNTTIYTYYYNYWGWYGYYYPYYPYSPPVYYASYTTGMANIEILDLKNPDTVNQRTPIRWNAFIRGLLTGNHSTSEVTGSVDQAFIQTPQLQTSANQ